MATFYRTHYKIAELLKLNEEQDLVLQPKFQRRLAWEEVARAYLIDTVIRGASDAKGIPPFYQSYFDKAPFRSCRWSAATYGNHRFLQRPVTSKSTASSSFWRLYL